LRCIVGINTVNWRMRGFVDKLPKLAEQFVLRSRDFLCVQHHRTKHHRHLPNGRRCFEVSVFCHSYKRYFDLVPCLQNGCSRLYRGKPRQVLPYRLRGFDIRRLNRRRSSNLQFRHFSPKLNFNIAVLQCPDERNQPYEEWPKQHYAHQHGDRPCQCRHKLSNGVERAHSGR